MVGSSLQRSLRSKSWERTVSTLPEQFTLNKGHVKFFYNKGEYLSVRYGELRQEMIKRGMSPDPARVFKREQWPDELYKQYIPDEAALALIRERIQERIDAKPGWYRRTLY